LTHTFADTDRVD